MITLDRLLEDWMPRQRWFAGKGRQIEAVVAARAATLRRANPRLDLMLVTVDYAEGPPETYVVPVSVHSSPQEHLQHALLGTIERRGMVSWVYDGLADRDVTPVWTRMMADSQQIGAVSFQPEPGARIPRGMPGDVLIAEQSNSSLIYGEHAILKIFRKVEIGPNPDVEIHRALRPADNPHIAPLLGHVEADGPRTIAMLQAFLPVATDGWSLATASVRDLYTERDLRADEVGGDFAGEAQRLGAATASVHADLARLMPTEKAEPGWLVATAEGMLQRLAEAVEIVPELAAHAGALRRIYAQLREATIEHALQRIHGDLHLGQVLRTAQHWVLLDFEGEPARPLASRRQLDTPIRDLAGMLRSFDYAAHHLLLDEMNDPQLAFRAVEWSDRNREAFCDGYAEASGADPREHQLLLRAFEADKAVYEAVYEARHRPHWLQIPLAALHRLTTGATP